MGFMDSNFVNIVGYQLEKVHTGVIKWLLDFKNIEVTLERKYEILRRIYKICHVNISFDEIDISNITCVPEFSFGRKRKIDLVIRIDLNNGIVKYLVIEMKVDSIPYENQLLGTYDDFIQSEKCSKEDTLFLLFLFGTSQVCTIPNLHGFHMFRLPEILEVFSGHYIDKYVYNDWMQALRDEDVRRTCIKLDIDATNDIWKEDYWKEKGHRTWFPLFYYMYNELRQYSKMTDDWDIYSGQNNPVMNWRKGWLEKDIMGSKVHFYWEFNYEDFVLKVMLEEDNKMSQDNLNVLRRKVSKICNDQAVGSGQQTQNRYGNYNSIFKWKYNFNNRNFTEIMQEVDTILHCIHPELEKL
jgi:hypothetical protein